MSKTTKWILLAVVALIIVGLMVLPSIRRNKKAKEATATEAAVPKASVNQRILNVDAEILRVHTMSDRSYTTGNILPAEQVDLSFETSGKIVAIYFTEGDVVQKGDVLAKINDAPLQAQLKKLNAQIPLASDRVYRQQTLLERDAVSQEAFESVLTDYNKLMADIELVKAQIDQTELKAPFDGILGLRQVSEGAFASSSVKVVSMAKTSELKIEFSVPETYASEIKRGTPIRFTLQDEQGRQRQYSATVYALEPTVDAATRTRTVRARYANKDGKLLPGRYISVEINRREIRNALSVPAEALVPEMGRYIVYRYKNGKAQIDTVETGLRTESRVQILSGLQPGDTLLTTGVMQLRQGTPVQIDQLREGAQL